jgi:glutamine amidotransferase-like uncharacterized protein
MMFSDLIFCNTIHIQLSRRIVENINLAGGSFLGVSRGGAKTSEIVDSIQVSNLIILHGYVNIIISYFKNNYCFV